MTPVDKASFFPFSRTGLRAALRIALIFAVYLLAFTLLDLSSQTFQVYPGVVAWYPPDGLSFALLLTLGTGFIPALAIASLISNIFIFQIPLPLSGFLLWAFILSLAFGLAAWFLRRRARMDNELRTTRDLFWMIAAAAVVSTVLSVISVYASGVVPADERIWATFQWWTGEMIGILVLTPTLLIHVTPYIQRFVQPDLHHEKPAATFSEPSRRDLLQVFSIVVAIYLAVDVSWPNDFHPYFLIGIPLVWIATEHGLAGATLANVFANFGITWAIQGHNLFEPVDLGQLQLMMLVITATSLLIGIIVSENKRAALSPTREIERRRKTVVYDLIVVAIIAMTAWVAEYTLNFYAVITEWEARYQIRGVEETIVTILVLGMASAVFSYRRWREFQTEIREREKAQGELQALYRELEARVLERTADLSSANQRLQAEILERKRAEEEIQTRTDELSTLYELSRALADANDLDKILELANRRTVDSVHATFARIALVEGGELIMRSAYPIRVVDHDLLIDHWMSIAAMPHCRRALEQDEPLVLRANDMAISAAERAALLLDFAQTVSLIPLRVQEFASQASRTLGLLMVGEARQEAREPFTEAKMRLARSIGNQTAVAIDKARLFNDLQRSNIDLSLAYDATISGWSAALDLRDKETEGHAQRVTETTVRLAEQMGFGEQELIDVRRGALLHDTGKMGVPDNILLKPEALTNEEWEIMRRHPTYAYQMLKPIAYLGRALEIPYSHHEKWDGSGYPQGLKGPEIPLSARVFAVVDVYDALTSDRPYRPRWTREKTLAHIRANSGSHFDPQVVDVFIKMIEAEN